MSELRPLRVAIVGSGPSGMYAAGHLLETPGGTYVDGKLIKRVCIPIEVDVIDRLPTPWGLIRGGVAPDHPDKKKMSRLYDAIAHRPGFRLIGNVQIGDSVTPADLSAWYDAVIYAFGADDERRLGVPGEDLPGSSSARQFVGWYNGHPDFSQLSFDLSGERAVIVGNGNVSMDVARILLKPIDELRKTDIAAHALEALSASKIREILILGRRGPQDAAFNFPELEELGELPDTAISVEDASAAAAVMSSDADSVLKMQVLKRLCKQRSAGARRIILRFHTTPIEVMGAARVEGLRIAVPSNPAGESTVIRTGLVLAAIGYRGRAMAGLPFDDVRGVIPNRAGRVLAGRQAIPGSYVTGWIRRGPQGIIGSNKKCARDCVQSLLEDAHAGRLPEQGTLDADTVMAKLGERRVMATNYRDWQTIDATECREGARASRPRIKLSSIDEIFGAIGRQKFSA